VEATGHPAPFHWEGGRVPAGFEHHPVVYVNRYDADAYCRWRARGGARLPAADGGGVRGRGAGPAGAPRRDSATRTSDSAWPASPGPAPPTSANASGTSWRRRSNRAKWR
jgi:hypothetical protein